MTEKIDNIARRVRRELMHPINTSAVIIMGFYTFLWGVWLASPFWHVFDHAPLYMTLAGLAPEWAWGLWAIAVGLVMVYGVVRKSHRSLTTGAFVGMFHWLLISLLYFFADWHSTGGITALMVAAYCSFVYLNLRMNKGIIRVDQ